MGRAHQPQDVVVDDDVVTGLFILLFVVSHLLTFKYGA